MVTFELTAYKFVRSGDAHGTFDAGCGFEGLQAGSHIAHPDHPDDDALFTLDGVNFVAKLTDALAYVFDLLLAGMRTHGNDHGF
jgi:hypothetical protein